MIARAAMQKGIALVSSRAGTSGWLHLSPLLSSETVAKTTAPCTAVNVDIFEIEAAGPALILSNWGKPLRGLSLDSLH